MENKIYENSNFYFFKIYFSVLLINISHPQYNIHTGLFKVFFKRKHKLCDNKVANFIIT